VLDRDAFRPVLTAVAILKAIRRRWPRQDLWRDPPYEYEEVKLPFDILSWGELLRHQIDEDLPLAQIKETWMADLAGFVERRRPFIRYGRNEGAGS